jgi:hypothetical protein
MEPNQTPSLEGGSIPQVARPDTTFSGDLTLIKGLQEGLPKYQGINPYKLKQNLINDDEFYKQFTDEVISSTHNNDMQRLLEQDPETYEMMNMNFRKNLRKELINSVYAGQTARDTLIDRTTQLRHGMDNLPIESYYATVKNNLEKYKEYELTDGKNFLYQDKRDDKLAFTQLVKNNPELHRQIINDRYGEFLDALGKSHNNPALVDDVSKKTQAWVVFDNFGSEGLTQYINGLQATGGKTPKERVEARLGVTDFFQNASVEGKRVNELIEEFIVGDPDREIDHLTFNPVTPRQDITVDIPEDFNEFTASLGLYEFTGSEFVKNDYDEVFSRFLKEMAPDDYQKFLDYENITRDGEFSTEYRQLTHNVYEWAYNNDKLEALEDTVKQAGVFMEGGYDVDTEPVYRINYDEVEPHVRLALNALQMDAQGNYNTTFVSEGVWDYRPDRMKVSHIKQGTLKNFLFATTTELRENEDGSLSREVVTDNSGLWGVWNTAATVALGAIDAVNRFGVEPLWRNLGEFTNSEGIKRQAERFRDLTGADMSSGLTREEDGMIPNAVGEVMPMVQYLAAMFVGGKYILGKGLIGGLRGITGAKTAMDFQRYSMHMKGANRAQAMSMRLSQAATKKSPWLTGPNMIAGGALVEATQPRDTSFWILIPELFGEEPTNDVASFYRASSRGTQIGMDVMASLGVDFLFDGLIAGSKFLAAKGGQNFFNRKEFKGFKYDPDKYGPTFGGYEVLDAPKFRMETVEFWKNLTSDLDALPIGSIGQTMARGFVKGQTHKSVHDFTKGFVDDTDLLFRDVKKDIEDQVWYYKRKFADDLDGVTDADVKALVDEQYNYFMNNLADEVNKIFGTSSEGLSLKFAQTLDEQVPTTRLHRSIDGRRVALNELDSPENAGKFLVRKGDEVYEVNPKFWTVQLADKIRTRSLRKSADSVFERKKNALGEDASVDAVQRLRSEVDTYIGTPVSVAGKAGYVVDFDDAKFVVRTADGDITTTNLASQISDEYIDQVITSTTNDRVIRQRLMFPLEEPAPQQPRALLADPAGAETTALALRPREITDTVRREQELLRQIDEIDTAGQRQVAEVDETVQTLSGRKNDLQRRHELMDDIVDDPTLRGNNRRAITREIKEIDQQIESLNARRGEIESQSSASMRSAQRELAQFHKEFPETMESRRLFGGTVSPKTGVAKYIAETAQSTIESASAANTLKRLQDTSKAVKKAVDTQLELPFC